ncbi:hypothetical protein OGAPHI_006921 [Ogataea philodendri]|uniref:Uncharacterized protein n=1 Tax=Ogataea philodendri TaxID=1378263 RepID=A0A9P8SZY0_9ASCO|nr:uncharacterized protein OGAPHI_006921 [Ogataea philodendri]KAH3660335.1 hypothetical protein OGAPHI_006921 [Ogataea philodendri]
MLGGGVVHSGYHKGFEWSSWRTKNIAGAKTELRRVIEGTCFAETSVLFVDASVWRTRRCTIKWVLCGILVRIKVFLEWIIRQDGVFAVKVWIIVVQGLLFITFPCSPNKE